MSLLLFWYVHFSVNSFSVSLSLCLCLYPVPCTRRAQTRATWTKVLVSITAPLPHPTQKSFLQIQWTQPSHPSPLPSVSLSRPRIACFSSLWLSILRPLPFVSKTAIFPFLTPDFFPNSNLLRPSSLFLILPILPKPNLHALVSPAAPPFPSSSSAAAAHHPSLLHSSWFLDPKASQPAFVPYHTVAGAGARSQLIDSSFSFSFSSRNINPILPSSPASGFSWNVKPKILGCFICRRAGT